MIRYNLISSTFVTGKIAMIHTGFMVSLNTLIWLLKYKGNKRAATLFAEVIYSYLVEELADAFLFEASSKPVLIPMPRDAKRIKKYGHNQTKLIADELALLDKEQSFTIKE